MGIGDCIYKNCYQNIPSYLLNNSIINSSFSESINEMDSLEKILNTSLITNELINYTDDIIKNKTEIINAIIDNFINTLNISDINNGNDIKMLEHNLMFILTSTHNQKINEKQSNISMDLGQCENILKMNIIYHKKILYIYYKLFMRNKE